MKLLLQCLAVGAGGALGAIARFLLALLCGRVFATTFPVGTFIINITGSFFLGWFLTIIRNRLMIPNTLNMAIAVGFVGAYTTFSTYMWESSRLIGDGEEIKAAANIIGSVIVGLIAVFAGAYLARS